MVPSVQGVLGMQVKQHWIRCLIQRPAYVQRVQVTVSQREMRKGCLEDNEPGTVMSQASSKQAECRWLPALLIQAKLLISKIQYNFYKISCF